MRGKFLTLSALIFIALVRVQAQPDEPSRPMRGLPMDFVGATPLPGATPGEQRIDFFLRVPRFALVAVKGTEPADPPFLRRGELTVECTDSNGTAQGRVIEEIVIPETDPVDTPFPLSWIERGLSITVPRGTYTVTAELVDLQSRNRVVRSIPVNAIRPEPDHAELSFLYLSGEPGSTPDTLSPQNFGNGLLFSAPGGAVIALPGLPDSVHTADFRFKFILQQEQRDAPAPVAEGSVKGIPFHPPPRLLTGPTPLYVFEGSTGSLRYLMVPLPLEQLPLRRLRLDATITAAGKEFPLSAPLMVVWPDQPTSLRDVDGALNVLRFVVSERELDSLTSGNREERMKHLEGFWKKKDPTPATADNPIMTEFYRRVDHARTAFATLKVKDGVRTDRGKIYLLQGPPTSVDRKLDPSKGFTETWYYERSGKQFVFRDETRDGSYVLIRQ